MTLAPLLPLLERTAEFRALLRRLREPGSRSAVSASDAATACTVATLWAALRRPVILLTPRPDSARRAADQLAVWCGDDAPVHHFAEIEALPFERLAADSRAVHQRVRALAALQLGGDPPPLVVASVAAAAQRVLEPARFAAATHVVRVGDEWSPGELLGRWIAMGYAVEPSADAPGIASRRGGILDVYPVTEDAPVRIEFFGDEVESIRRFDPETQRSFANVEFVAIPPASDTLPALADRARIRQRIQALDLSNLHEVDRQRLSGELRRLLDGEPLEDSAYYAGFVNHGMLLEYAPADCLVVSLRPAEAEDAAASVDGRLRRLQAAKESRGELARGFPSASVSPQRLAAAIESLPRVMRISPWGASEDMPGGAPRLPFQPPPLASGDPGRLWDAVAAARTRGGRVVIVTHHAARVADLAKQEGLEAAAPATLAATPAEGSLTVLRGHLRHGLALVPGDQPELLLLSDAEVFGIRKERRVAPRRRARRAARPQDLRPGAYLVHVEHGIGKFTGTTSLDGADGREYLVLEYAENDKLYVPTDHLDRLSPYHGSSDSPPRLTRLGTLEWTRAKARARKATEQLAGELIALYAARAASPGFQNDPDTPWQDQLEDSFPYEETPDQVEVIAAVKTDLENPGPMDRLVCGDVGYGKTEVALRAAFKVIQSGRQVAVLVPTTVLAQQHLATFRERLSGFPVVVESLSRLRSDAEQASILRRLRSGEVDICIGTHRLLQRDVAFRNLGLVVIDEEHRFGVAHKERLKRMRRETDVLTMSATPIPRTLYASLTGIRDMSMIDTPPEDRLPIRTYVSEESPELVREAILRELDRGGQVFFLHNRVRSIDRVAAELSRLVPEARIGIGHGQMPEDQLETVMTDFDDRQFDVLVCTTIIESGLDLPNVNTLIVDRADTFGLAQLYQLRGRIGRGARQAYAYFLVPVGKRLTEAAEQRLNTILAATELGAGYQIAMRDLEIRGAGNILGAEQSGHIAAVGYDLYTKLLNQAVAELKAEQRGAAKPAPTPGFSMVGVDLGINARLPYTYVEDLPERLTLYRRVARISLLKDVDDMRAELRDRFGPLPKPAELLLYTVRVRVLAESCDVDSVIGSGSRIVISLRAPTGGARAALQKVLGRRCRVGHMQIRLEIDRDDDEWQERLLQTLRRLRQFRQRMLAMVTAARAR